MFRWDQGDRTQKHTQKYCKFDLILVEPGLIEQIRYNKKMLLRPSSSKLNVDFVAMRQSESPGTINRSMPSTQFEISFINTNSWGNDNKKTRPIGHRHRHSANTIKYIRCTLVVLLSNMRTHALSTLCLWYFVFTRNRKKNTFRLLSHHALLLEWQLSVIEHKRSELNQLLHRQNRRVCVFVVFRRCPFKRDHHFRRHTTKRINNRQY